MKLLKFIIRMEKNKTFDSSDTRWMGFLDAEYRVTSKNLEDWIKKESIGGDIAYSRIPD